MAAATQDDGSAREQPVEEMSYTDASSELDSIVDFFEQRDVDVDQLVGRLVRATAIIEELDKRLRHTRVQVEQLVPKLTSVLADVVEDPPAAEGAGAPGGDDDPEDGDPGDGPLGDGPLGDGPLGDDEPESPGLF